MADNHDEYMLTTVDNPYNPHDDFDKWFSWDIAHGYNTAGYLARIVHVGEDWPEELIHSEIDVGIAEILRENPDKIYARIKSGEKTPLEKYRHIPSV